MSPARQLPFCIFALMLFLVAGCSPTKKEPSPYELKIVLSQAQRMIDDPNAIMPDFFRKWLKPGYTLKERVETPPSTFSRGTVVVEATPAIGYDFEEHVPIPEILIALLWGFILYAVLPYTWERSGRIAAAVFGTLVLVTPFMKAISYLGGWILSPLLSWMADAGKYYPAIYERYLGMLLIGTFPLWSFSLLVACQQLRKFYRGASATVAAGGAQLSSYLQIRNIDRSTARNIALITQDEQAGIARIWLNLLIVNTDLLSGDRDRDALIFRDINENVHELRKSSIPPTEKKETRKAIDLILRRVQRLGYKEQLFFGLLKDLRSQL